MGNKVSQDTELAEDKTHSSFQEVLKSKFQDGSRRFRTSPVESGTPSKFSISRRNSNASGSEKDPQESLNEHGRNETPLRTPTRKHPECLIKLAKILVTMSQGEENSNGISLTTFTKFICQNYAPLGTNLYQHFLKTGKPSGSKHKTVLSKDSFIASSHKIMDLVADCTIMDYYISVFAEPDDTVTQDKFCDFLQSCYLLSREASTDSVNEDVIKSIVTAVFRNKKAVSVKFLIHWLEGNCPRILTWLHRYLVHRFTVGHRLISDNTLDESAVAAGPLNLDTPVLESPPASASSPSRFPFDASKHEPEKNPADLKLDPMQVWLLAASLPISFTKQPQPLHKSPSGVGNLLMDPRTFITQMIAAQTPTHWVSLYNSDIHGLSQNRFLHHVMGYRASSVLLLRGEGYVFCVAIDTEWKDSNHFWGGADCTALQISPEYHILDKGEKLMYHNTSIRGYPYGLHMGSDHKNPVLEVDKDFARISYRKIPIRLESIEVWGCGTLQQREAQSEYKRWELKQVEKSRDMKLNAADWNEHPDKYLLDLAGNRPNYSEYKAS